LGLLLLLLGCRRLSGRLLLLLLLWHSRLRLCRLQRLCRLGNGLLLLRRHLLHHLLGTWSDLNV